MHSYRVPGVYVNENPVAPSITEPAFTAVPAFIGLTEKRDTDGNGNPVPVRVKSLSDYADKFGGSGNSAVVRIKGDEIMVRPAHLMYHSLDIYFKNGGRPCYVVSAGDYASGAVKGDFGKGLDALQKEEEPTLILLTDGVCLEREQYHLLCADALRHCKESGNRFCIFDLQEGTDAVADFRRGMIGENLMHAAAYHPWIRTWLNLPCPDDSVTLYENDNPPKIGIGDLQHTDSALYNRIREELDRQMPAVPAGPAVAGVYARVDAESGPWNAPANLELESVIEPVCAIDSEERESLYMDHEKGMSVNGIIALKGRGTVVWGARTLAGNDREWQYIPVRRFFNMIEEFGKKNTAFAVFESNDAMTWLKVRTIMESYLDELWRAGALAGAKAEDAYFVNVGLGTTMTETDINQGIMRVEIGAAPARPAEFIIVEFSHKLKS